MSKIRDCFDNRLKEVINHDVIKLLSSGRVSQEYYAWYLWQQRFRYERLEEYEDNLGVFEEFPELRRYHLVRDDVEEIWKGNLGRRRMPNIAEMPATDFMKHLKEIFEDEEEDSDQILASLFVVVITDLTLGEMGLASVPGSGKTYKIDSDLESLKNRIIDRLDAAETSMLDEVQATFDNTLYLLDVVWAWSEVSKTN